MRIRTFRRVIRVRSMIMTRISMRLVTSISISIISVWGIRGARGLKDTRRFGRFIFTIVIGVLRVPMRVYIEQT